MYVVPSDTPKSLSCAMRVEVLDIDKVVLARGERRNQTERRLDHRAVDWSPDIDDAVATLQKLIRIFR